MNVLYFGGKQHTIKTQLGSLSPDFFKDVSFHVSFHVKFGNMGCCDFSINNPQNRCLVTPPKVVFLADNIDAQYNASLQLNRGTMGSG